MLETVIGCSALLQNLSIFGEDDRILKNGLPLAHYNLQPGSILVMKMKLRRGDEFVKMTSGKTVLIHPDEGLYVADMKQRICDRESIRPEQQHLACASGQSI